MDQTTEQAMLEAAKIIKQRHQAEAAAGFVVLALIVVFAFYWTRASNEVEADKQWCRQAPAREFVDQFESKCQRYSYDPAIRKRIDDIIAGREK
jgi:hypothetical protein